MPRIYEGMAALWPVSVLRAEKQSSWNRCRFGVMVCAGVVASSLMIGCWGQTLSDQVRQDIATQVEGQRVSLAACYQQALGRDRELTGRLTLRFVVAQRSGEVREVAIEQSDVKDEQFRKCVVACAAGIKVKRAPRKPVVVTYPVVFEPAAE